MTQPQLIPWWAVALAALPPLLLFAAVFVLGIDVPYWDQWGLVPDMDKLFARELHLSDLWRPHNEHRLFFPKAIIFALAYVTRWNIRIEMAAVCALAALTFAVFAAAYDRLVRLPGIDPPATANGAVVILFSVLVFGFTQWENWLMGMQLAVMLSTFAVVAAAFLLRRPGWLAFSLASVCAVVASYSFSSGLIFWPVALPILAAQPKRIPRLTAWVILAAITFALYFHGFTPHPRKVLELRELSQVKEVLIYFFLYLGAPLGNLGKWTILCGAGGCGILCAAALAAWLNRRERSFVRLAPWLSIALFAVGCAAVTALGRYQYGVGQALSSRYVTTGNMLWIALPVLVLHGGRRLPDSRRKVLRRAFIPLVSALFILLVPAGIGGAGSMVEASFARKTAAAALKRGDLGQEAAILYPAPEELSDRLQVLRSRSLTLFREGR